MEEGFALCSIVRAVHGLAASTPDDVYASYVDVSISACGTLSCVSVLHADVCAVHWNP